MKLFFKNKYFIILTVTIFILFIFIFKRKTFIQNNSYKVFFYDKNDKNRVLEILKENFYWIIDGSTWEEFNFEKKLDEMKISDDPNEKDSYKFNVLVIKDKNNYVCGFITYYIYSEKYDLKDKKIGRIHLLGIDKKYQRIGLAKILIKNALKNLFEDDQHIENAFLITRNNNVKAQNLYSKLNFNLYSDGKQSGENFYIYTIDKEIYLKNKIIWENE